MGHLKPRTATVLIYQGDDLDRITELRRNAEHNKRVAQEQLDKAESAARVTSARIGDAVSVSDARAQYEDAVKPSQEAYDEFVDEAAERALEVQVQSIGRRRFRKLVEDNPPRMVSETITEDDGTTKTVERVHDADGHPFNVNTDTFPLELLAYIDSDDHEVRSIVAPEFKGRHECVAFLDDELAEGDFDKLWGTAFFLNRQGSADPKATRYSTTSPRSVET